MYVNLDFRSEDVTGMVFSYPKGPLPSSISSSAIARVNREVKAVIHQQKQKKCGTDEV